MTRISFLPVLLLVYLNTFGVKGDTTDPSAGAHITFEEEILNKLNSPHYSNNIRPNGTTVVKVNMYIRDAYMKTSSSKASYDLYNPWSLDMTIRQSWNDPRLAYSEQALKDAHQNFVVLPSLKSIWAPDTFFPSADKGDLRNTLAPNAFVWIYPNGDVLYSNRVSLTLPCRQKAVPHRFGHGTGVPIACPMRIASYGYPVDQVSYEWDGETPIDVTEDLYTHNNNNNGNYCVLVKVVNNATYVSTTRAGQFSSLPAEFQFLC